MDGSEVSGLYRGGGRQGFFKVHQCVHILPFFVFKIILYIKMALDIRMADKYTF